MKIIFLCHGNICRSPMAEYIFKDLVRQQSCEDQFEISSGAVSREEIGNPIYPPAKRKLSEKGVPFCQHSAHQITNQEFAEMDLVIVMDRSNLRLLSHIIPESKGNEKVHLLMEYAGLATDVADPWYTGDFETTYQDIYTACVALLDSLKD